MRYDKSGWQVLGSILSQAKLSYTDLKAKPQQLSKFEGIELLLDMIDWSKLKKDVADKSVEVDQLQLAKPNVAALMMKLVDFMEDNSQGKHEEESKLKSTL